MTGRFWTGMACAVSVLALAACSSGGGGDANRRPPITLKGASYDRFVSNPQLREIEGGSGSGVIFLDDGVIKFLGKQRETNGSTTTFVSDNGALARVTSLPGYENLRLLRVEAVRNGSPVATEGIVGTFTSERRMGQASGFATYSGAGRSVAVARLDGPSGFVLEGEGTKTSVVVLFGPSGSVAATLDFSQTAGSLNAPIDTIQISGMRIEGNRFRGGILSASKGSLPEPSFAASGATLASSGVFSGWNDGNGTVSGGNRPGEVGGAFVANTAAGTLTGYYLAD